MTLCWCFSTHTKNFATLLEGRASGDAAAVVAKEEEEVVVGGGGGGGGRGSHLDGREDQRAVEQSIISSFLPAEAMPDNVAERSKAPRSGRGPFGGVGSNPTVVNFILISCAERARSGVKNY